MEDFECEIHALINLCSKNRLEWLHNSKHKTPEDTAKALIDYLQQGLGSAYSYFWTYKLSNEIIEIIKENHVLALISNDKLIRAIAKQIPRINQLY